MKTSAEDGGEFSSAEMQSQYESKKADLESQYSKLAAKKTLPIINITTLDGASITSKSDYVTSVVDVFNCDDEDILSAEAGVKVRGNSTATDDPNEKPYRIKFTKKHNMLGLHNGEKYKSWVLLRTYWNLAPDYTAFKLAAALYDGKYYVSDCTYVNLYINGEYKGLYLLCEQNQAADGRVDVYEPEEGETTNKIGYFLELDNYPSSEHPYFSMHYGGKSITDIAGISRVPDEKTYSIKSDTTTDSQKKFIKKYMNGVFDILLAAVNEDKPMMFDSDYNVVSAAGVYSTAEEAVEAVIDLDSVVDMLILAELTHDYDIGEGSFYMAVDFSEDATYKKLTFLAPWDFDWAYFGDKSGKYYACTFQPEIASEDRSNTWFIVFMKASWFRNRVKIRWKELNYGDDLKAVTSQIRSDLGLLKNDLGSSSGKISSGKAVCSFVDGRIDWLKTKWGGN
jgi:hypothetical protein